MKFQIEIVLCILGAALLCIGCNDQKGQSLSLSPVESVEDVDETGEAKGFDTTQDATQAFSTNDSDDRANATQAYSKNGSDDRANADTNEDMYKKTSDQNDTTLTTEIGVYTCGAVSIPGVYYFPEGTRVHEALQAAGGMTEEAAVEYLNQAEFIYDGQRLYVPTTAEVEDGLVPKEPPSDETKANGKRAGNLSGDMETGNGETGETIQSTTLVNINTATAEQLKTLPGVGDAKAKSIIAYRENIGSYQRIEDIMLVEGIKEGMYAKLKDYIVVR